MSSDSGQAGRADVIYEVVVHDEERVSIWPADCEDALGRNRAADTQVETRAETPA